MSLQLLPSVLVKTIDQSLTLVRRDAVQWKREDALAGIEGVLFSDLSPKHHISTLPEDQNIVSKFIWRIANDISSLKEWIDDLSKNQTGPF